MNAYRVTLFGATITTALMAGLYFSYVCSVMPGLGRGDDATYVRAMNQINVAIQNPLFFLAFGGSLLLIGAAALLGRTGDRPIGWLLGALGCYLGTLVLTAAVNVPLNNRLAKAGTDFGQARHAFALPWNVSNTARLVLCVAALVCLVVAISAEPAATPAARSAQRTGQLN